MTKKHTSLIIIICFFMLLPNFIEPVFADQSEPTWLKEGTYVKYTTDQTGYAYVLNASSPRGYDTLCFYNATFGWHCLKITNTKAKIEFNFNYVGKTLNNLSLSNATLNIKKDVFVDLKNRAVYDSNGAVIGTTHMWVCANPSNGQEVVIWDIPPERVSLPAKTNYELETCQGIVKGFVVEGNVTINHAKRYIDLLCDSNTGLMVDGFFDSDPIMLGSGISALFYKGRIYLSDTNIELITYNQTDWSEIMLLASPIIAFVVLFVAIYKHMQKKY